MNRIQGPSPVARAFRPVNRHTVHTGLMARGTVLLLFAILAAVTGSAHAEPQSNAKSWIIWPQGGLALPTGRFAEKDEASAPPKDGHKSGYVLALDGGYFLNEFLCIGVEYGMSRFDLDLVGSGRSGETKVWWTSAWAKYFLRGGFARWQPYVVGGVGVGRPKGTLVYDPPAVFPSLPSSVMEYKSTVDLSASVYGGLGVLVPASRAIALSMEGRFHSISSEGTGRTDIVTMSDGTEAEIKGDAGEPLKAKSNTNWWEIRLGLVFLLR